ncbi:MAG: hydroxymethylpyrimidine/phosphomethylpyrimidine kinase [Methyloversatilis sp.]|jgi:hydroxymethylpyrimidine/phosphomethylpyrimidine kinase|nr:MULTISPECIES: hydroxymethylpyrimidine/phosphomethylpyrimidine kinase [Methyloversatilis]MCR6668128.1 hydroxymethylpyrimidine/phosphomethylpyrimidine kinase [Methyloversatilis sp.]PZU55033.1 MAG: hydroxymethylpyrimidine/phosphomethylpyrimidine kinase [Thauera sp.]
MCFSATDPTGGAGMQADLMTLSALGCHPLTVVTAVTVQDSAGVEEVVPMDDDLLVDQARVLLADMPVAAFKIGVMGSIENIAAIAEIISDYPDVPVVLDPVLSSGRGDELADEDMVIALQELLLPLTTVLTPNSLEARRLAQADDEDDDGDDFADEDDESDDDEDERDDGAGAAAPTLEQCARQLIAAGCGHVLLTGTHESTTRVANVLYGRSGVIRRDEWDRLPGSYHGSGCTLASALAAWLAHGLDVGEAAHAAQEYTWRTLQAGFRPGMGQHLPDRFFFLREHNAATADRESDDDA